MHAIHFIDVGTFHLTFIIYHLSWVQLELRISMSDHSLPTLPYAYDALEPSIDAMTMEIHHSKHHQTYINNYLGILEDSPLLDEYSPEEILQNLNEVPVEKRQWVINNVGGHVNHSFFWEILSPDGGGEPWGELTLAIDSEFGSFEWFKEEFTNKAKTVCGSGWAWLVKDVDGTLLTRRTSFQDSPLIDGQVPIIWLDLWEHAYYLKHQNKRPDYIADFWNVVNWEQAERNYWA